MKKKIIAGLLALLMLLSVVACGTNDVETSGDVTSGESVGESETAAPTESEEQPATETEPETEPETDPATEPGTVTDDEPAPETPDETKTETPDETEASGGTQPSGATAGSTTKKPAETTKPAETSKGGTTTTKPATTTGKTTTPPETKPTTEAPAKTPAAEDLTVISGGKLTYSIVVEEVDKEYSNAMSSSRAHIKSKFGVTISYKVLRDGTARSEQEIVIGKTLDEITALVGADKISKLESLDFYLGTKGTKVYIAANTPEAVSVALTYLMEHYYNTSAKTMVLPGNMAMKTVDVTDTVIHGTETKIVIPGLKKTYKFIHVTDTHITLPDSDMGVGDKDDMTYFNGRYNLFTGMANETTGYGIASHLRFPYFFRYAEQNKADLILMSGDIVDFPTDANVKFLKDSIAASKTPVMYTLGNHDWNNGKHYGDTYAVQNYIPRFKDITGGDPVMEIRDMGEFMIVAMDNSMDSFSEVQITVLKQLCTKGKPIILMFHVPLYSPTLLPDTQKEWGGRNILIGTTNGSINRNQWTGELEKLLSAQDSPIVAVIAGHLHFDHTDRVTGNVPQYLGDDGHTNGNTRVYIVSGS